MNRNMCIDFENQINCIRLVATDETSKLASIKTVLISLLGNDKKSLGNIEANFGSIMS